MHKCQHTSLTEIGAHFGRIRAESERARLAPGACWPLPSGFPSGEFVVVLVEWPRVLVGHQLAEMSCRHYGSTKRAWELFETRATICCLRPANRVGAAILRRRRSAGTEGRSSSELVVVVVPTASDRNAFRRALVSPTTAAAEDDDDGDQNQTNQTTTRQHTTPTCSRSNIARTQLTHSRSKVASSLGNRSTLD
jgi:hypothetical protein